jgi:peptide/nickel transport system substrate-binding protein
MTTRWPSGSADLFFRHIAASAFALAAASFVTPGHGADSHRGGTMRLLAHAAAGTLDPQINYTTQFWQVEQATYDGLLAFRKAGGAAGLAIVPDLAEALPAPQDGGKTYVFKLRSGIRFSDGAPLTVDDVAATFRRIFQVSSPTAGSFYNGIVGADACLKTPAGCTLPGVVADAQAGTVTFHLTAPDAEFFDKLAVQHASIVPHTAPPKDVGVAPLPGTGPYMIAAYEPTRQMKLVRNPYFKEWSHDAAPDGYPDAVLYDYGLTSEAEITEVQNGQADWTFDAPPADRLGDLGRRYGSQVHLSPLTEIYYASMNVNIPPFNDLRARLAVNDAIDRNALVKLYGGPRLATPFCQILPPGIPGYAPYCPYGAKPGAQWSAPDMAHAKQLVQQSGTAGQTVTVIVDDGALGRSLGTYLASVLTQLGYKATSHPLSSDIEFTYIQNTNNKMQIGVSYWAQDYPAPSDFLNVMFSCGSFHPGSDSSVNISGFCDHAIDARMQKAMTLSLTDAAAADTIWTAVDRSIADAAPAAVLFVPRQIDFVSKRVGNFTFSPQDNWIVTQSWVQ